ncbi:MAG TPA: hypothetical protein VG076_13330 [Acidimicrobiales bacterium]|jgi:hypothetical protein|nr:hypothetical protein [Acidimicrobiales bacterium]
MATVPMRTDCKNYESRTYDDGETVRKCNLDLAPEAPWRCPNPCRGYEPRLADVNWVHTDLVAPPTPDEPEDMDGIAELLDEAEDVVNAAAPEILDEFEPPKARRRWWPFGKRTS